MNRRTTTTPDAYWDAGDAGCGQLIMGLRSHLEPLDPGATLEVIARSDGAPVDLWVWCRMTGHRLISQAHPRYVIERRAG